MDRDRAIALFYRKGLGMAHSHKTISHTLNVSLVRRLARLAYRESISRSSIVEHAVRKLFDVHPSDRTLAEELRMSGAVRRRTPNA